MVKKVIVEERMAHCKTCEHNVMTFCTQCGCCTIAKTRMKDESCPIGLWDKELNEENLVSFL
jgi:hypothetical protein